jgi:hypothetical protein
MELTRVIVLGSCTQIGTAADNIMCEVLARQGENAALNSAVALDMPLFSELVRRGGGGFVWSPSGAIQNTHLKGARSCEKAMLSQEGGAAAVACDVAKHTGM